MALTPSPTVRPASTLTPLNRPHSVALLRDEIRRVKDPRFTQANLDAVSRRLQEHVMDAKVKERRDARRQRDVMARYGNASRAAFASVSRVQQEEEERERERHVREHVRQLRTQASRRSEARFVADQLERVIAADEKDRIASVQSERSLLYQDEMERHNALLEHARLMEEERRRVVRAAGESTQRDRSEQAQAKRLAEERQRVEFLESSDREAVKSSEIVARHQLLSAMEHGQNTAQRRINVRSAAHYRTQLETKRRHAHAMDEVLDSEAQRRGVIMNAELKRLAAITLEFRRSYETLVAMARQHFGHMLAQRNADRAAKGERALLLREHENRISRDEVAKQRAARHERARAEAADRALADRETRLRMVLGAEQAKVAEQQAKRKRMLEVLRGERAPLDTAPFKIAAGVSRVPDSLPPELREEVIRMIREH
jgi:hypothetical protein